jgi:hypothetical protein
MSDAEEPSATDVALAGAAVGAFFDGVLDSLTTVAQSVMSTFAALTHGAAVSEEDLTDVGAALVAELTANRTLFGVGYVAAPDAIAARSRYMLWMQHSPQGIVPLALNLDADDPEAYDYVRMDWYLHTSEHRTATTYGPYLDYSGAGPFVLVFHSPVIVGDRFVGTVGADLLDDLVEAELVRLLRELATDSVVVNPDRSVVAANTPRWLPGERLDVHPLDDPTSYLAVKTLGDWKGWVIASAPSQLD